MKLQASKLSGATQDIAVEPTDTVDSVKKKLESFAGYSADCMRLSVGSTLLDDDAKTLSEFSVEEGSILTICHVEGWDDMRFKALKALFLKQGEIHEEPKDSSAWDVKLPDGHELPESLKTCLKMGARWNFTKGSCDVFNCNIWLQTAEQALCFFGDEELRKEWCDSHGPVSCANESWAAVGASSEYDYYFVNLKKDSPHFGAVRHIVNNCYEEEEFTPAPFENFLNVVERYAKCNSKKVPEEGQEPEEVEYENFLDFR